MTVLSDDTKPEGDNIVLQLRDSNGEITGELDTWESYSFNSHFLTPTDAFSFSVGDEVVRQSILTGLYVGQRVTLSINGFRQADGYIDNIKIHTGRDGTKLHIEGRDRLSPVVDANAGGLQGIATSKKGKPLKSAILHQLKPYPQEGVFAFLARITQRFGLWIWLTGDGEDIIVGRPDFTQDAGWPVKHKLNDTGSNNVITGEVSLSGSTQPSVIIATGFGGGGEYGQSALKVAMVNELTGLNELGIERPEVTEELARHPDAVILPVRASLGALLVNGGVVGNMVTARHRALFLHDDESKTIAQLENYVRREMSLFQRNAVTARYTFENHSMNGAPWCIDTMVKVDDDVSNMHTNMWLLSRTFEKSRESGTRTNVELIMPFTLDFGGEA